MDALEAATRVNALSLGLSGRSLLRVVLIETVKRRGENDIVSRSHKRYQCDVFASSRFRNAKVAPPLQIQFRNVEQAKQGLFTNI
jgi:hypothetical protein